MSLTVISVLICAAKTVSVSSLTHYGFFLFCFCHISIINVTSMHWCVDGSARVCVCVNALRNFPFRKNKKISTEHEHILCLVRNVLLLLLLLPLLLLFSLTNLNKNSRCFNSSLYTSTERNETKLLRPSYL